MKLLVIGNPVAGTGKAGRRTERLLRLLENRGHEVEWLLTGAPGDARRRARELEGTVDRIVVAGGDGTVNEVLNGLADPSRTPLTHLAFGTANLLARELGIPKSPEALADVVERGAIRWLDLGRVGEQRFLLLVSSGFDAMVTREIRRKRSGTLGFAGYARPILKAVASYRPPRLEVTVDGGEIVRGALVVVSNVRNYGGLFAVADRARCDSGHLDVCIFQRATRTDIACYLVAASLGRVSRLARVEYRTARGIRVDSNEPVAVEVDGDYWGTTPISIAVDAAVVPILVPPDRGKPDF